MAEHGPSAAQGAGDASPRTPPIEVDAATVARALGLSPAAFRELFDSGRLRTLCERGTGEDAGRFRLSFYHGKRRFRLVTDAAGTVLEREVVERHR